MSSNSYSFIPAGEEDDFDSDDGFVGDEDANIFRGGSGQKGSNDYEASNRLGEYGDGQFNTNMSWKLNGYNGHDQKQHQQQAAPTKSLVPPLSVLSEDDLKLAAIRGNVTLAGNCLDQGISVDQHLRGGWTALMYASNYARPEMVQFLLSRGADIKQHEELFTPLMCACSSSISSEENIQKCVEALLEAGSDVNASDRYHSTALMLACKGGHMGSVKSLLHCKAAVNKQDHRGWTALTWAIQGSKDIVILLLDAGADCSLEHSDKLTAKDMAACLPSDEIVSILEHRPVNNSQSRREGNHSLTGSSNLNDSYDYEEEYSRSTNLQYGDLRVFLLGLNLPHVTSLLQEQMIDLDLLLTLTEQDLINAGVKEVGARKKILDAVQAVHKKDWDPSSLVSVHFNKVISCAEATAMVANVSKHVKYIGSTAIYVKEQLRRHPEILNQSTDQMTPAQLLKFVEDTMQNTSSLRSQLRSLHSHLKKELAKRSSDPPDVITQKAKNKSAIGILKKLGGFVLVTLSVLLVKKYVSSDNLFGKLDTCFAFVKMSSS